MIASELPQHPLLTHASPAHRAALLDRSQLCRFDSGELILAQGDAPEYVYLLCRGSVRVYHRDRGLKEVTAKVFHAPAIFGEAEAFAGINHVENVQALAQLAVLRCPFPALVQLLWNEPTCAMLFITDLAKRFAMTCVNQRSLAFDGAQARLADYLLDLAHHRGSCLALTQDDMAAAVGLSRRAVAGDVTRWQQQGILERNGRRYIIRAPERLRACASDRPLGIFHSLADAIPAGTQ